MRCMYACMCLSIHVANLIELNKCLKIINITKTLRFPAEPNPNPVICAGTEPEPWKFLRSEPEH